MPTLIQLTSISGKFGFVEFAGGFRAPFGTWKVPLRGNFLESNNFNRFPYGIVGVVGGEVTFGGDANVGASGNYSQAPLSLRIRDEPYLITFGFSAVLLLPPVRVVVKGVDFGTDVNGKGLTSYVGEIQGADNNPDPHFFPGDSPL